MIKTVANKFKFVKGKGEIDFSTQAFKVALMAGALIFDPDTHGDWGDVSAHQIAAGNGYTAGGALLVVDAAWAQDNINNKGSIAWTNVTWTAAGGAFPDFTQAIVYNDTHATKAIVGCINFETTISVTDGSSFQLQNLGFDSV